VFRCVIISPVLHFQSLSKQTETKYVCTLNDTVNVRTGKCKNENIEDSVLEQRNGWAQLRIVELRTVGGGRMERVWGGCLRRVWGGRMGRVWEGCLRRVWGGYDRSTNFCFTVQLYPQAVYRKIFLYRALNKKLWSRGDICIYIANFSWRSHSIKMQYSVITMQVAFYEKAIFGHQSGMQASLICIGSVCSLYLQWRWQERQLMVCWTSSTNFDGLYAYISMHRCTQLSIVYK